MLSGSCQDMSDWRVTYKVSRYLKQLDARLDRARYRPADSWVR